jgi:hypothetical protein
MNLSKCFWVYFGLFFSLQTDVFSNIANAGDDPMDLEVEAGIDFTEQLPNEVSEYILSLAKNPYAKFVSHRWHDIASSDFVERETFIPHQKLLQTVISARIGVNLTDILQAFKEPKIEISKVASALELLLLNLEKLQGTVFIGHTFSQELLDSAIISLRTEEYIVEIFKNEIDRIGESSVLEIVLKKCLNSGLRADDRRRVLGILVQNWAKIESSKFIDAVSLREEMFNAARGTKQEGPGYRAKLLLDFFEFFYLEHVKDVFDKTSGIDHTNTFNWFFSSSRSDFKDLSGKYKGFYFKIISEIQHILSLNFRSNQKNTPHSRLLQEQKNRAIKWTSPDDHLWILESVRNILINLRKINEGVISTNFTPIYYGQALQSFRQIRKLDFPDLELYIMRALISEFKGHPQLDMGPLKKYVVSIFSAGVKEMLENQVLTESRIRSSNDPAKQQEEILTLITSYDRLPMLVAYKIELLKKLLELTKDYISNENRMKLLLRLISYRATEKPSKKDYSQENQFILAQVSLSKDRDFLVEAFWNLAKFQNITKEDFDSIGVQAKILLGEFDFNAWWEQLPSTPGIKSEWISSFQKSSNDSMRDAANSNLGKRKTPEDDVKQPDQTELTEETEDDKENYEQNSKRQRTL